MVCWVDRPQFARLKTSSESCRPRHSGFLIGRLDSGSCRQQKSTPSSSIIQIPNSDAANAPNIRWRASLGCCGAQRGRWARPILLQPGYHEPDMNQCLLYLQDNRQKKEKKLPCLNLATISSQARQPYMHS